MFSMETFPIFSFKTPSKVDISENAVLCPRVDAWKGGRVNGHRFPGPPRFSSDTCGKKVKKKKWTKTESHGRGIYQYSLIIVLWKKTPDGVNGFCRFLL